MGRVAVIGAGIAGLTAAYDLKKNGLDVVVFECQATVGGMIRTLKSSGFLVEEGPNSIQAAGDTLARLIPALGLDAEQVPASEAARNRFIVRGGEPLPAPASPKALLTSSLFGTGAKLRLMREPFIAPSDPTSRESVAEFVRRRLGSEVLDYGLEPFVAGVFAGDPENLSLRHAFPRLHEMEQTYGSIVKGQVKRRQGAEGASETRRMFSFKEGLSTLPKALRAVLGSSVETDARVERVEQDGKLWRLVTTDARTFDAVVFAAPLPALASMDVPSGPDLVPLTNATYAPLRVLALGLRREHVAHALDGFGMLIPRVESDFRILGTLFTSSIFPGRAPQGHVLLTSFVGGMRHPELASRSNAELEELVKRDLNALLGLSGAPVFVHHRAWRAAIPQYDLGYDSVLDAIETLEAAWPGWFMAGNYREGVSIGDAAASGERAAQSCRAYLDA